MKFQRIGVLLLLVYTITTCNNKEITPETEDGIQIRIKNTSTYTYHNTLVNTATRDIDFGSIPAGKTTAYTRVNEAYRYAFVALSIDGKTYTIQPIDYVGETILTPGKYTYNIGAKDTDERFDRLTIFLMKD